MMTALAGTHPGEPHGPAAATGQRATTASGTSTAPREIATGVACLSVLGANVYFVQSGAAWVLIDTAWARCDRAIRAAAAALFGATSAPAAILLTHAHPDHSGSADTLARLWGCPVYVHAGELPIAAPADLATIERDANPLDRWVLLPVLRAMPRRWVAASLAGATLRDSLQAFGPGAGVPGLPDWQWIATPGHSPGHVAYFRPSDRLLVTGDAVLSVDVNSVQGWLSWGLGRGRPGLFLPPWYTNSDQCRARLSIVVLAGLQPRVLATGHGPPLLGTVLAARLRTFARRVTRAS